MKIEGYQCKFPSEGFIYEYRERIRFCESIEERVAESERVKQRERVGLGFGGSVKTGNLIKG